MLCEFSGKEKADGSLDLAGREGALLVVAGEAAGLQGKALEDVVDERVQDGHTALADAGVGVDLLKHLVDVAGVGFHALSVALAGGGCLLGGLCGLLANSGGLCHF